MAARRDAIRAACLAMLLGGLVAAGGCGAPPATLDLIDVARKALAGASAYEADRHADALKRLDAQASALDAAFDADVRLAEAGKITSAAGEPVALTGAWVISARKGYAAARDGLAEQRRRFQAAHDMHLDNLQAAGKALDLAGRLILEQYALTASGREALEALRRRFTREP